MRSKQSNNPTIHNNYNYALQLKEKGGEEKSEPPSLLLDRELLLQRSAGLLRDADLQHPVAELGFRLVPIAVGRESQRAGTLAELALTHVDHVRVFSGALGTLRLDGEIVSVNGDVEILIRTCGMGK